uniref:SHSP domain-containing protein n=1 Tax=Salvator merianae TaxID=96440 RepID=A0A8D0DFT1_SALMN
MLCRLHLAAPHSPLRSRALWPTTRSLFEELEREMESVWELLNSHWQPTAQRTLRQEVVQRTEAARTPEAANPGSTFAVTQDMTGFDPQELVVKLVGEKVVLTGKKATQTANGPFRYELYRREWEVPENVDRERLTCSISSEGQLPFPLTSSRQLKRPLAPVGQTKNPKKSRKSLEMVDAPIAVQPFYKTKGAF